MRSYINMYRNYANFKGFLTRGPYWAGMIIHYILLFAPYYLLYLEYERWHTETEQFYHICVWMLLYRVISFIPTLSATVRRLHTLPESGWFMLIGIIPVVGWIIILINLLKKGVYEEAIRKIKFEQPGLIKVDDRPHKGGWFWAGLMVSVALGFYLFQVMPNAPASYIPQTISGVSKVQSTLRGFLSKTPNPTKISQKAVTTPVSIEAANKAAPTSTITVSAPVEEPMPENGAFAWHNGNRTQLRIIAPEQDEYVFIKVFEVDGGKEAVGSVFIHPGNSESISMAPGQYYIKAAFGTKWFGDEMKFGFDGTYQQFYNESIDGVFDLQEDYVYTLMLQSSTVANVGTFPIDLSDF